MDLSALIHNTSEPQTAPQEFSKEEYAAMKKAERETLWMVMDAKTEEVFQSDESMRGFLNFVAACTPQSTKNLIMLYEQNPDIRHPRTFEKWKEAGRSIRSGEKGYTFFVDQEYTKEDGTQASGYTITTAFDISQTKGPQPVEQPPRHVEELLAAMIEQSPVRLEISGQLPDKVQAQYVPKNGTIYVRNGMDEVTTFCAIAREQAHASFDTVGRTYHRQSFSAQAYCAAYIAAQKNGLDTSSFRFDAVCKACAGMDTRTKRSFISDVKSAAYSVNRGIQRSFRDMEQKMYQNDEFAIGTALPEGSKPEQGSKNKTKELKRDTEAR